MIFEDRVIKTPRLEIKQLNFLDKTRLSELLMNKEISQTYMIPDFKSIEEANSLADRLIAISKERLAVGIHLIGMLIGWINDCDFDADSIEIGYVIDPVYKGQGYATEAVKAIIQY